MPFRRSDIDVPPAANAPTDTIVQSAAPSERVVSDAEVREWVAQLHSHDAAVRSHALTRLQEFPDALASLAPALLQEGDPSVRSSTLTALASTTHPEFESWLGHVLDGDPDVNVCSTAVDLLGEVGTGASRAVLEALPDRFPDHPFIRFAVRVALERLTDE